MDYELIKFEGDSFKNTEEVKSFIEGELKNLKEVKRAYEALDKKLCEFAKPYILLGNIDWRHGIGLEQFKYFNFKECSELTFLFNWYDQFKNYRKKGLYNYLTPDNYIIGELSDKKIFKLEKLKEYPYEVIRDITNDLQSLISDIGWELDYDNELLYVLEFFKKLA